MSVVAVPTELSRFPEFYIADLFNDNVSTYIYVVAAYLITALKWKGFGRKGPGVTEEKYEKLR
jgi:hypothetical protein